MYYPYSPDPRHKAISIKRGSRNSRAALSSPLPFSVCRCPLRKYHEQIGSQLATIYTRTEIG